jgi:hypothetical protein
MSESSSPIQVQSKYRHDGSEWESNSKEFLCSVRVRSSGTGVAKVYSRKLVFPVGRQASFSEDDANPSAVEYLLGALGGDLGDGFQKHASRRGVTIDGIELLISGKLENPLAIIGVVGVSGQPRLESAAVSVYVSANAESSVLQEIWKKTVATSPLANTLQGCVKLSLELRSTD